MTTSDTSFTPQTPDGVTISNVLSLGAKIVESLRQDDLLSQWMAHHVAQRMAALEHVPENARRQAEDDLAALVLRLWEHGRRDGFDEDPARLSASVVRAVAKLDPQPGEPYFRAFGFVPRSERTETELDQYLDIAVSLDRQVGTLMLALVTYAAALAEDQEADWIEALRNVDADPLLLIRDLRRFEAHSEHEDDPDPLRVHRESVGRKAASVRRLLAPLARHAPKNSPDARRRRVERREDLD